MLILDYVFFKKSPHYVLFKRKKLVWRSGQYTNTHIKSLKQEK